LLDQGDKSKLRDRILIAEKPDFDVALLPRLVFDDRQSGGAAVDRRISPLRKDRFGSDREMPKETMNAGNIHERLDRSAGNFNEPIADGRETPLRAGQLAHVADFDPNSLLWRRVREQYSQGEARLSRDVPQNP